MSVDLTDAIDDETTFGCQLKTPLLLEKDEHFVIASIEAAFDLTNGKESSEYYVFLVKGGWCKFHVRLYLL